MNGHQDIIDMLRALLGEELASMQLYIMQAQRLKDWGYNALFTRLNHEADDERGHAERVVERLLYLGGDSRPSSQPVLDIGDTVTEMLDNGLRYERALAVQLNEGIALCRKHNDAGTRALLEQLLWDTEMDHILWLRQQRDQITQLGLSTYLAEQLA